MQKDTHITEVQFRIFQNEVIAVFPYEIASIGNNPSVMSYQHLGQHSGCIWYINNHSKKATFDQYKDLMVELENHHGYNLKVIQRRNHSKFLNVLADARK
jgi:hypothetical protein